MAKVRWFPFFLSSYLMSAIAASSFEWRRTEADDLGCYSHERNIYVDHEYCKGTNKPLAYKWNRSKEDQLKCFAYSTLDGNLLYSGMDMDDAYCKSLTKPLSYKWLRSPQDALDCFAIFDGDGKPLYNGMSVDVSYCKSDRPLRYEWGADSKCYAFCTLDEKILYGGMDVDQSFCERNTKKSLKELIGAFGNFTPPEEDQGNVDDSERGVAPKKDLEPSIKGHSSSGKAKKE